MESPLSTHLFIPLTLQWLVLILPLNQVVGGGAQHYCFLIRSLLTLRA